MYQKKLIIDSDKKLWQTDLVHGKKESNEALFHKIGSKCQYRCAYCGWEDPETNELSHIDMNHMNNHESNIEMVCMLCHQFQHLGQAGANNSGSMIFLPDITQEQLNSLIRVLWVAAGDKENIASQTAENLLVIFEQTAIQISENYTEAALNPDFWAELMIKIKESKEENEIKLYENRQDMFKNILMLPTPQRYEKEIELWRKRIYVNFPRDNWPLLIDSLMPKVEKGSGPSKENTDSKTYQDGFAHEREPDGMDD